MAAAIAYQVKIEVNCDGRVVYGSKTYTGEQDSRTRVVIADGATDEEILCAIDVSALVALILVSDQDLLVEVNSPVSAGGDLTLVLKAGLPYIWTNDFYYTNLFTVDVTAFYVTNSSGSSATLEILPLVDPTNPA